MVVGTSPAQVWVTCNTFPTLSQRQMMMMQAQFIVADGASNTSPIHHHDTTITMLD
jgi:hypothetical protein